MIVFVAPAARAAVEWKLAPLAVKRLPVPPELAVGIAVSPAARVVLARQFGLALAPMLRNLEVLARAGVAEKTIAAGWPSVRGVR